MVLRICKLLNENSICKSSPRLLIAGCRNLSEGYVPNEVEQVVSSFWQTCSPHPLDGSVNKAKSPSTKFSMILPPPNVTGTLHLGHALTTTLQDVIAKRGRMKGEEVVWVPGLDHAGIATQAIVELVLAKAGLDAKQMPRDALLDQIRSWKASKSEIIFNQLRQLVPSLDWSRQFFTLDQNQSRAVKEAFRRLYSSGLIYRSERLVNWSVSLGSAISDMEVEYLQINGPTKLHPPSADQPTTFGVMTDVSFNVYGRPGEEVVISTCRLETMPGDVAVAVHPEDSRYSRYHGCVLIHPLTTKLIPLILDTSVDPSFGTGAVKVTPGHDQTDFSMALRHNLDVISIIDEKGRLNSNAGCYAGLNRFEAREVIADVLRQGGQIKGEKDHQMSVPLCSRTKDVIELISKPQWFLKCDEMGRRALEACESGQLQIIPDQYLKSWTQYLENIRDWCISRQVVWGHRIPLYTDGKENFFLANSDTLKKNKSFYQVDDVLDTWFSSALLPFSAFGWPRNVDGDFKKYFPLDLMVTGHDILFFWVARMVMLTLQLTDQLPFKKVLLHSVVCDPQGRKMSKSLGNVIDPIHIIEGISHQELLKDVETRFDSGALKKDEAESARSNVDKLFPSGIPQCGTDALRITLLSQRIKNHYVNFDTEACYGNKLFCNKLWQACKFTSGWCLQFEMSNSLDRPPKPTSKLDMWLLEKFNHTLLTVNNSLDNYEFHIAVNSIKEFVQNFFCDVYLEGVKSKLRGSQEDSEEICYILLYCLVNILKLLAPMAPFVSETLYQQLQPQEKISVHQSDWPNQSLSVELSDDIGKVSEEIVSCLNIAKEIRRLKTEFKSSHKDYTSVGLKCKNDIDAELITLIEDLSNIKLEMLTEVIPEDWSLFSAVNQDVSIFYVSQQKSQTILVQDMGRLKKLEKELEKLLKMRSHEAYHTKVVESVRKSHSDKILKLQVQIDQLKMGK